MKEVPLEFMKMVEHDILSIENTLAQEPPVEAFLRSMHMKLDGKYQACIQNWGHSMYGWNDAFGFSYEFLGLSSIKHNLEMMKAKLSSYKYQVNAVPNKIPSTNVTVNVDNNISLQITFESARAQIDENNSLTEAQARETKGKIDEIELIAKSGDTKRSKWDKAKPVLVWLADKSVDVGKVLLPLLLKIP